MQTDASSKIGNVPKASDKVLDDRTSDDQAWIVFNKWASPIIDCEMFMRKAIQNSESAAS